MSKVQKNEYRDDDDDDKSGSSQPENISDISVSDISDVQSTGKRRNKLGRGKKLKRNQYVEEEAEEASQDERDLDEEVRRKPELKDKEYDTRFNQMLQRRKGKDVIKSIEERYKDVPEGELQDMYDTDGLESQEDDVDAPKLTEPKVWRVGCTRAKENESAMSVMFKYSNHKQYDQPLEIVSAFALKKFPGAIFIEAQFDWQVQKAIEGLYELRYRKIEIVDSHQCVTLFAPIQQEPIPIENGCWVRIKRHQIYENDLGRVLLVDEIRRSLQIKIIPREKRQISSFQEKDEMIKVIQDDAPTTKFTIKGEFDQQEDPIAERKSNRWSFRTKHLIEQKRFVRGPKMPIKYDKNVDSQDQDDDRSIFYYPNLTIERERCKRDGFVLLHTPTSNIIWMNIKPTLDELAYFYPDLKNIRSVMPRLLKSLKAAMGPQCSLQVGDKVSIDKEHPGIRFSVKEILPDGKLVLSHTSKDKNTQELRVYEHLADIDSVRQIFMKYQQITVISGPNVGVRGVIIDLKKNTATISTEHSQAIECLLSDLQTQVRVQGYDQNSNSNPYKAQVSENLYTDKTIQGGVTRNDLIKFGEVENDIGCVLSLQKDDMTILDLNNSLRHINMMTFQGKLNTRNNVAKNTHRHEIRKGDLIVILDGFYKGCKATVIHVYRDVLYIHSGKFDHTQGIIVEKVNNCALISSVSAGTKEYQRPNRMSSDTTGPIEDIVGKYFTIASGRWSGYRGMVVSLQPKTVTVQLTAKNLTVKVLKEELQRGISINQQHQQAGMTPHYAPQGRSWGDDSNHKSHSQGYQSPYVYGSTPTRDQQ